MLCLEGRAIGAGNLGGVLLVSHHANGVQGAVILILTMMLALLDGAFNALVCVAVHSLLLLFSVIYIVLPFFKKESANNLIFKHVFLL